MTIDEGKGPGLVSVDWLQKHLFDPQVIVFDCRYDLLAPGSARADYESGHIPGAYYLDLEVDLAGPLGDHGGRHPLPTAELFAQCMAHKGVTANTYCVAYDIDGVGSARLWWLLRYFGHDQALVLDGGLRAWQRSGGLVTAEPTPPRQGNFEARPGHLPIVDGTLLTTTNGHYLMDSRSAPRYRGEVEPIDHVAGHIPGAKNYDYQLVFDEPARYRPASHLANHFGEIASQAKPIVYCGSGVSACVNLFALNLIGVEAALYPGSWSDWISYRDNPIAIGPNP